MTLSQRFGRLFPSAFRAALEKKIVYAGFKENAEIWLGSRLILLLLYSLLGGIAYAVVFIGQYLQALLVALGVAGVIAGLFYLNLYYRMINRTRRLEKLLPDFLLLVAANLRAGMTPFGAFAKAIRPEFGDLYEEAKNAAAQVGGRRSLGDALNYLVQRFDSPLFVRSMGLFLKGIRSGSQLARLLTTNAEELRRIQDLREELVGTTRTYLVFIGFVVIIVMPFLLSVSAFFIKVFVGIRGELDLGGTALPATGVPLLAGEIGVTPEEVTQISLVALVITSLFASMLMGIIRAGRWVYGIKYFPLIAAGASVFFFLADAVITRLVPIE